MQALIALSLVQVAMTGAAGSNSYTDAYNRSQESGKPLMVVVGADWCPACVTLKQEIAALQQQGALLPVELSFVDKDAQPQLANQLMRGRSLPEIIFYSKSPQGWRRMQLNGRQSQTTLKSFIRSVSRRVAPAITGAP